jgi:hypothetical protein
VLTSEDKIYLVTKSLGEKAIFQGAFNAFFRRQAMYHSNRISATVRKIIIIETNANQCLEVAAGTELAAVGRRAHPSGIEKCLLCKWCSLWKH